jgi:uncharacterized protein with FMN-binding domain
MKRALIVGTGTIAGVAAVLALNPEGAALATGALASSHSTTKGSTSTGSASNGSAPTATPSASATSGAASGTTTVQGSSVDVGYGIVQLEVTVTNGRIVDITALSLPQNDRRSADISRQAFPMLVSQALAAQNANIAGISGASYTSYGFTESLKAALVSAGLA